MSVYYPQGRYKWRVTNQGFTVAGTGNTQFILAGTVWAFIDPAVPADSENSLVRVENYERTAYMTITPNTNERIARDLQRIGYDRLDWDSLDPFMPDRITPRPNFFSFIGEDLEMQCKHDPKQGGGLKETWQIPFAGNGEKKEVQIAPAAAVMELNAKYAKAFAKASAATTTAPAATKAPAPNPKFNQTTLAAVTGVKDDGLLY